MRYLYDTLAAIVGLFALFMAGEVILDWLGVFHK